MIGQRRIVDDHPDRKISEATMINASFSIETICMSELIITQ
jgi:hypothetical protein